MKNYNLKDFFIKKKFFFMFILVCLTYFVSIFSGPVVEDTKQIEYNVRNIYLPFGLGFSVSSDSGNYMRIANNPTLMYEEHREVNGRILVFFSKIMLSQCENKTIILKLFSTVFFLFKKKSKISHMK